MTAKTPLECSSSVVPAVLDTVFTATHAGGAIAGAAAPDDAFGGSSEVRTALVIADAGLALLHAASAYYGYTRSGSCREAEARAKELADERRFASTLPPVTARPNGVAGFKLGMSEKAAKRACTAKRRTFRSDDGFHTCDDSASRSAQTNSVQLKFDERGLWSIEMVIPAGAQWPDLFAKLRKSLIDLYGDPVRSEFDVPDQCEPEVEAAACAERGEMDVLTKWQWSNSAQLVLQIAPRPGPLAISVLYTRPQSVPPEEPGEDSEPSSEPPAGENQ